MWWIPQSVRQILRSTHIYICRDLISVYIFNLWADGLIQIKYFPALAVTFTVPYPRTYYRSQWGQENTIPSVSINISGNKDTVHNWQYYFRKCLLVKMKQRWIFVRKGKSQDNFYSFMSAAKIDWFIRIWMWNM